MTFYNQALRYGLWIANSLNNVPYNATITEQTHATFQLIFSFIEPRNKIIFKDICLNICRQEMSLEMVLPKKKKRKNFNTGNVSRNKTESLVFPLLPQKD